MSAFRNYDAWLEAPFQRAIEEGDRLAEAWDAYCEAEDVDPEDEEAYDQWLVSLQDRDEDPQEACDDGHPDML